MRLGVRQRSELRDSEHCGSDSRKISEHTVCPIIGVCATRATKVAVSARCSLLPMLMCGIRGWEEKENDKEKEEEREGGEVRAEKYSGARVKAADTHAPWAFLRGRTSPSATRGTRYTPHSRPAQLISNDLLGPSVRLV